MKKHLLTIAAISMTLATLSLTGCEKEDKDAISKSDVNKGIQVISGPDGKDIEVVDLGLQSGNLWAVCNIGATSPEGTGSLFAWGEVSPKNEFSWSNYKWGNGINMELSKYCTNETYGTVDNKTVLEEADDAATAILGEGWRIPDESDFRELLTTRNCTAKWCKLNGVGGFLFTSVRKGHEGNSIFIPLAGMSDNGKTRFAKDYGWLWCNSIYYDGEKQKNITTDASVLCLQHTDVENKIIEHRTRYVGLPIRAIYVPQD